MYFNHPVNDTYSIYDGFYGGKEEKNTHKYYTGCSPNSQSLKKVTDTNFSNS